MVLTTEDIEIEDPENYRNPELNKFSHQTLVMNALKRVAETGSKELKEGYWNEKIDKNGNHTREYVTDTRKEFISSVKTLLMFMDRDYDEEARKVITMLLQRLEERKQFWLNEEWRFWNTLNDMTQRKLASEGKAVSKGFFNPRLQFDNFYFEDETETYRQICTEINKLIKRIGDYESVDFEA